MPKTPSLRGRATEDVIKRWLWSQGFGVLTSVEFAPVRVQLADGRSLTLVELVQANVVLTGVVAFKTRTKSTLHHASKRWEQSIEHGMWREYNRINTVAPVWLCFLETGMMRVLLQSLSTLSLSSRLYTGGNMPNGKSFIFMSVDKFDWFSLSADNSITPLDHANLQDVAPVEPRRRDIQPDLF